MNKKGLAILMRTRMRPSSSSDPSRITQSPLPPAEEVRNSVLHSNVRQSDDALRTDSFKFRELERVRNSMSVAISNVETNKLDTVLDDFSEGYYRLSDDNRRQLLLVLANEYDIGRDQVRELMKQYLGLELPSGDEGQSVVEEERTLSVLYRMERNMRHALKPKYEALFERLNMHPGGLKFLTVLRADILSIIRDENNASMRALDSYLKEKLITWLSPAALELRCITWDDPASLLEKIVAYEAVHPISSLLDLKRRLGVGRRCFGYFHPAIPGEPLIFIEVALLKNVAQSIQEVLWDTPPIQEYEATCALFYSISSTQPGLAGVNLGKFLIKRVIELVKKEMPQVTTFATLSPIPGFMGWLISKLASQSKLAQVETNDKSDSSIGNAGSVFREDILLPEEERELLQASGESVAGKDGVEVLWNILKSKYEWTKSEKMLSTLKPVLMRLCARYLLQEKKRGKALDSVANFHLQNGAMVERLNWMADQSDKGLTQSAGIMVNYLYRLDSIEENAQSYFSEGNINASISIQQSIEKQEDDG